MLYDCILIGGGPAGAFCAQKLAELGYDILLLEQASRNRYKPCGGGVALGAIDWLGSIEKQVFQQYAKIELYSINSHYRNPDENVYAGQKGLMVYRTVFDQWLRDLATKKGATVMYNAKVTDVHKTSTEIQTILENGDVHRGNCVIVASGVNVPFLQKIGLNIPECVVAIQREYSLDENLVRERFGEWAVLSFDSSYSRHGYAWAFPKRDGISVGVVSRPQEAANLSHKLNEYCSNDSHIAPRLQGSRRTEIGGVHFAGHLIPTHISSTMYRDRMLVIGDAGGFADPFAFEGLSYAFHSGALASTVFQLAEKRKDYSTRTLAMFQQGWLQEIYEQWWKPSFKMAKALYDHNDMDILVNKLFVAAQNNTEIGMGLTDMTSGYVNHRIAYQKIMSQKRSMLKSLGILNSLKLLIRSR